MKIAIIIAYFGKLPEYIQLFLDSCKLNYGFEWLIFSDDDIVAFWGRLLVLVLHIS